MSDRPTSYVTISGAQRNEMELARDGAPWGFWGFLLAEKIPKSMAPYLLSPKAAAPHSHFHKGGERNGLPVLRIHPPQNLHTDEFVLWLDRGLFAGESPTHIGLKVQDRIKYCHRCFATELLPDAARATVSETLSRGLLYRYDDATQDHPGRDPHVFIVEEAAGAEDGTGVGLGESVGLLNPLVLGFTTDAAFPEDFPEPARQFCARYRQSEQLVDVIPVFPPEAWGRCLLHQHLATRHCEGAGGDDPPPLARLLFLSRWHVAPLPFLVLDGFGGSFHLSGLAEGHPARARWHPGAGDGDAEHAVWMRDWSIKQLDILIDATTPKASIPSMKFDTRPYEVQTAGILDQLDSGFFGSASAYPVLKWWNERLQIVPGALDAPGNIVGPLAVEETALRRLAQRAFKDGCWYPDTFIRILGEERLLPRSTILVDPPGPPEVGLPAETVESWRNFVATHTIDLIRAPRRPALWWLQLHFEAFSVTPDRAGEAWDVNSSSWWYPFYRSLFLFPESFVPQWTSPGTVLDHFVLDTDYLDGVPSDGTDIRDFKLA